MLNANETKIGLGKFDTKKWTKWQRDNRLVAVVTKKKKTLTSRTPRVTVTASPTNCRHPNYSSALPLNTARQSPRENHGDAIGRGARDFTVTTGHENLCAQALSTPRPLLLPCHKYETEETKGRQRRAGKNNIQKRPLPPLSTPILLISD